ncbi:hypothetical protein B0H12DRAFT_1229103 [Mycena haematopus]|nr:hypothetical protein B0H12DRAFT_1229103 [Mycena haematopus]
MSTATNTADAAAAATLAAAISETKQIFGSSFIGAVATAAYGIVILQCYLYFRNYPKDHILLKSTVATLWVLDTLTTIMVAHALYTLIVLDFGDSAADAFIPWSFALENGLLTIVTLTAQCFYSWQIWSVSKNILVASGIILLALTAFAACDIVITLALIYYLWSKRKSGVRTTKEIIDTLILYTMCRGIVTVITQIMFLILNIGFPHRTLQVATSCSSFHLNCIQMATIPSTHEQAYVYVNSILASLNTRKSVRGRGDPEMFTVAGATAANTDNTDSTRTMPLAFLAPKHSTMGGRFDDDYNKSHDKPGMLADSEAFQIEPQRQRFFLLPSTAEGHYEERPAAASESDSSRPPNSTTASRSRNLHGANVSPLFFNPEYHCEYW